MLRSSDDWARCEIERSSIQGEFPESAKFLLNHLGKEAIDRCLESAIRSENLSAAEVCFGHGADPNLNIWNAERSYNRRYCLLSYVLDKFGADEEKVENWLEVLFKAGSNAQGTEFDGLNKPLFLAIKQEKWKLADQLIDMGASFSGGCGDHVPEHLQTHVNPHNQRREGEYLNALKWVKEHATPLIELSAEKDQPLYYFNDPQMGYCLRFLPPLLIESRLDKLKHFEQRGLPVMPAPEDLLDLIHNQNWSTLKYLFNRLGHPDKCLENFLAEFSKRE